MVVGKPRHLQAPRKKIRKAKASGSRKKKGILESIGDVTLRDAADAASSVVRGGLRLATAMWNVEEKIFDVVQSGVAVVQGTPNIQSVNLIAEGSDYNNRTGNSIRARNLYLSLSAVANATAGTNFLRLIVLQDLENQGATPSASSFLESTGNDIYLSHYKHILGNRFRVLADEHIVLISGQQAYFKRFVMPIGTDILYQGTSGATGDLYNGALFVALVTDNPTNGPTFAFDSRLTFVDN